PVSLSQVNITQVTSTNNFVSVNATGSVVLRGSALSGTYNAEYQICQISNPSSCAFALGTVSVIPNQIYAENDFANTTNGAATVVVLNDVLANDDLNGLPISLSQVSTSQVSATSNYITVNNNGALVFSNGSAPAGTYSVNYQICELSNPNNCVTGFAAVSIGCNVAAPIIGGVTQPSCGSSTAGVELIGLPATGTWNLYKNGFQFLSGSGNTTLVNNLLPGIYSFNVANNTGCFAPPVSIELSFVTTSLNGTYVDFNGDGVTNVGDVIKYQVEVSNNSSCALTNGIVDGTGLNIVGGPLSSLSAGTTDSTTFSATYAITQSDLNTGFVVKTATATVGPCTVTDSAQATTNLNITNGIKLIAFVDTNGNGIKDGLEANFTLGEYQYEINNNGTVQRIATNGSYYLYESNPATSYNLGFAVNSAYAFQYSVSPAAYNNVTVAVGSGMVTYNFPITVVPYTELTVYVTPHGAPPRPGFTYYNQVIYKNNGTTPIANDTLTFTKDNIVTILSVSPAVTFANANGYLTYTIRFENAGTANAVNVRVNDVLDAKLDETTVRTIAASHNYTLDRIGNNLTWKFDGINFPPPVAETNIGRGYIVFQVKPKSGDVLGDVISNQAIQTNTTMT
ncbi:MAG: hypothetical protein H7199_02575, partial [Burkholderiales bacterium]|nr:hypothetical protein [Flavobacterium sp.]